jgi:predicted amidohydrolase
MSVSPNTLLSTEINYDGFTVAAFQGRHIVGNSKANFEKVIALMKESEARKVDILCLPESFFAWVFFN